MVLKTVFARILTAHYLNVSNSALPSSRSDVTLFPFIPIPVQSRSLLVTLLIELDRFMINL